MLFPTSLLAIGLALLPSAFASPWDTSPIRGTSIQKRAVVDPICVTLDVELPGILLVPGIDLGLTCICATPLGGLTTGSILALRTKLLAGGNIALLNALGLTVDLALAQLTDILVPQLVSSTTTPARCTYTANSVPTSCTDCSFECASGFTLQGEACISNVSGARKRRALAVPRPGACPSSMQACSVIGISGKRTSQFECLDIRTNIESCGGCMVPFGSQPTGQDCTLIPNVEGVDCVKGRCVVSECARGLVVDATKSSCVSYVGVESK